MVPEQQHGELERMSKRKRDRRLAQLPYTPAEAYRLTPEQAILLQAKLAELAAVKQQESAKQQQEVVLQDDIEDIEQKVLQQLSLMKKLRSPGGRPPVPAGSPNDMVRSPFLAPASRKRKRQVEPKRSIICRSCGQVSFTRRHRGCVDI